MNTNKRSSEHQRAVLDRRRSNAAGTHKNSSERPRGASKREAMKEQLEDAILICDMCGDGIIGKCPECKFSGVDEEKSSASMTIVECAFCGGCGYEHKEDLDD